MTKDWLDELTRQTVIVHVKDLGDSLKGVLTGVHSDCLVLSSPIAISDDGEHPLGGTTAIVLRESVQFMQVVG